MPAVTVPREFMRRLLKQGQEATAQADAFFAQQGSAPYPEKVREAYSRHYQLDPSPWRYCVWNYANQEWIGTLPMPKKDALEYVQMKRWHKPEISIGIIGVKKK